MYNDGALSFDDTNAFEVHSIKKERAISYFLHLRFIGAKERTFFL